MASTGKKSLATKQTFQLQPNPTDTDAEQLKKWYDSKAISLVATEPVNRYELRKSTPATAPAVPATLKFLPSQSAPKTSTPSFSPRPQIPVSLPAPFAKPVSTPPSTDIAPISLKAINPYLVRWCVIVRVVYKSEMFKWTVDKKHKTPGNFFFLDLMDDTV
jgi:hypothetical protein